MALTCRLSGAVSSSTTPAATEAPVVESQTTNRAASGSLDYSSRKHGAAARVQAAKIDLYQVEAGLARIQDSFQRAPWIHILKIFSPKTTL